MRMCGKLMGVAVAFVALAVSGKPACAQRSEPAPEAATSVGGAVVRATSLANRHMVAAANPLAAEAGREMLRAGGSAADAAIAVQLVLGLVEPQSSGLGGGAFLLHWNGARSELKSYDGRETAPASAKPDHFATSGRLMSFNSAVRSGLSVGVPGTVRLIELVHRQHGRLPWGRLFEPAIRLAEEGFAVSPRLAGLLAADGPSRFTSAARTYFFDPEKRVRPTGYRLRNPAYAATLRRIAAEGAAGFYAGPIANAVVAAVAAHETPGDLTLADLAGYQAKERPPVCVPYRRHRVCGMGPPSSGALTLGQTLMLLDGLPMGVGPAAAMAPGPLHLAAEALRLAFADRNWYLTDADFLAPPVGYLDPAYIAERRQLIDPLRRQLAPYAGLPPGARRLTLGEDATNELAGTSHISIVDAENNAVAMTTTIEAGFGSGIWVEGFLLNNQLTDFSLRARDRDGRPIANRVEAGKRPRSSMTPTIVFDPEGGLRLVTGSSGGSRIIPYVLKVVIGVIDWNLNAQAAVSLPNFSTTGGQLEIEAPPFTWANAMFHSGEAHRAIRTAIGLAPLGESAAFATLTSGTQAIVRLPDGTLQGGADPRREGVAIGD